MEWLILSYKLICLIATTGSVVWCVYNFALNEDVSSVRFRVFQSKPEYIYPSITLCVVNPFLGERLKEYGKDINPGLYQDFLKGSYWENRMKLVDYDNVTFDLNNYILDYQILFNNFTYLKLQFSNYSVSESEWRPPYMSLKDHFRKCYSVDIPYQKHQRIRNIKINLKADLFETRIGAKFSDWRMDNTKSLLVIGLNYPNQVNLPAFWKTNFRPRSLDASKSYTMEFAIGSIEISHFRNKIQQRCLDGFPNYDVDLMNWLIETIGCCPPYFRSFSNKRECTTKQELQNITRLYAKSRDYSPLDYVPCRKIEIVQFRYSEIDNLVKNNSSNVVSLKILFQQQKFKEIQMVSNKTFEAH